MTQSVKKTPTTKTANQSKSAKRITQVKPTEASKPEIVKFPTVQKATTSNAPRKVKQNVKPTAAQANAAFELSQSSIRETANHIDDLIAASGKAGLSYWNMQGKAAIEYRDNWEAFTGRSYTGKGDNGKKRPQSFAEYRAAQADLYGSWEKNKWNEVISIAQNWAVVEEMQDTDALETLGFSSCIKAIKLHLRNCASPADKKIAAEKKASSDKKKEGAKAQAEADAADLEAFKAGKHASQQGQLNLTDIMKDPKKFGSIIGAMVDKAYDNEGKAAFVAAAGEKIIIAS